MNDQKSTTDELISRIKNEAKKHSEADSNTKAMAVEVFTAQPVSAVEEPLLIPLRQGAYLIEELLLADGDDFIRGAYRVLLERDVDGSGLESYRDLLAKQGKLAVLVGLRLSTEGIERQVDVHGMRLPLTLFKIARCTNRLRLRLGVNRLLRKLEQHYEHKLVAVKLVLARTNELSKRFSPRLAAAEAELGAHKSTLNQMQQRISLQGQDLFKQQTALLEAKHRIDSLLDDLAELDETQPAALASWAEKHQSDKLDVYYRAFEDAFRGSEQDIRGKLEVYLPRFQALLQQGLTQPVLDIGCGRGEWLRLLKEQGHTVRGVDMSPVMVGLCKEQGLEAEQGEAYAYLKALPANSLAAITGFHIIEHLPFELLYGIFEQAARVLVPGGIIVFETPNPENITVGSNTFYNDFSHRNPITPVSIGFLAQYHQFANVQIERLNPFPEEALVPGDDALTSRFNEWMCGPQDFAVIAQKPNRQGGL